MSSTTAQLGSDVWNNANDYDVGDELRDRAENFLLSIDWLALTTIASKIHGGVGCVLDKAFSLGHFNLVRKLTFDNGMVCVARLRMPDMSSSKLDKDGVTSIRNSMQVEVATMNFLRTHTTIPVPQVYYYDSNSPNFVGAPYMLMEYIHGTVASELCAQKDCPPGMFGTAEQDLNFRKQMAYIQTNLASHQFDKIGSLYQVGNKFIIGPENETGKGPWDTPEQYYKDLAQHAYDVALREAESEVIESESIVVPTLFPDLMLKHGADNHWHGPYGLVNKDFGAHNLLVDNDFNIVGMIDLDGVMTAPLDMVAQFPVLTGLDRAVPGHIETRPLAIQRAEKVEQKLIEYQDLIARIGNDCASGKQAEMASKIARRMFSNGASTVLGLRDYTSHQKFVNDAWYTAYLTYSGKAPTAKSIT